MKIMIHSNAPTVPSGYGRQTALALRQFQTLGHEVAVSSFHGGLSGSIVDWHGVPIYPAGRAAFGVDVLIPHARHFGADLLLTLMDVWKLAPIAGQLAALRGAGTRLAYWIPIDCTPLGRGDRQVLEQAGGTPIAMSRFGERQLVEAGYHQARYVPHSVPTAVYRPPTLEQRDAMRAELGVGDRFVVGICAANQDALRKAWPEQLRAFDLHRRTHPDSVLLMHTLAAGPQGFDLRQMAEQMGISDAVHITDEYPQMAGLLDDGDMALWFGSLDLLSSCSYAEGFGLPLIEAQACGTPALGTDGSAMTEHATELVPGDEFWNPVHQAWWVRPRVPAIAAAYDRYHGAVNLPGRHVEQAAPFDTDRVTMEYWKPTLEALEAGA